MTFQGAVIREQGVTFAIVIVKAHVIDSSSEMAQDSRGTPTYYGRQDIARFLAGVPLSAIPWKQYTL